MCNILHLLHVMGIYSQVYHFYNLKIFRRVNLKFPFPTFVCQRQTTINNSDSQRQTNNPTLEQLFSTSQWLLLMVVSSKRSFIQMLCVNCVLLFFNIFIFVIVLLSVSMFCATKRFNISLLLFIFVYSFQKRFNSAHITFALLDLFPGLLVVGCCCNKNRQQSLQHLFVCRMMTTFVSVSVFVLRGILKG